MNVSQDANVLEDRYRRVLRVLPADYRAEREEELVATFLESSWSGDEEIDDWLRVAGRPAVGEVLSVFALAARVRLAGPAGGRRAYAWGQAVRTLVLVCLLTNALLLPMALAQHIWLSLGLPLPEATRDAIIVDPHVPAWVTAVEWLVLAVWFGAFLALVLGRRRAAAGLALTATTPAVGSAVLAAADLLLGRPPRTGSPATLLTLLTLNVLVVLGLLAFHDGAPRIDRRRWLGRLAGGSLLVSVPAVLLLLQPGHSRAPTAPDVTAVAWLSAPDVLVIVWLAAAGWSTRSGSPFERLAVGLTAMPICAIVSATLLDGALLGGASRSILVLASVEAACVAGLGLMLARRALREIPRPLLPKASSRR